MTARVVRDVMQRDVIVVSPDAPLLDVHRLFVEEDINGAPVVEDADGKVLGVVSSLDLLRAVRDEYDHVPSVAGAYFRDDVPRSGVASLTAADAMVRERVAVSPEMTVAEAAELMRSRHIHRVLVIEDHELVGILTTFDLLALLADPAAEAQDSAEPARDVA